MTSLRPANCRIAKGLLDNIVGAGDHGRRDVEAVLASKALFIWVRITALIHERIPRFSEEDIMAPSKAKKPAAAGKVNQTVTLKHLAVTLAGEHHLTKRAGAALLGDLVGMITKHLKKGERVRIAGLGILQVRKRAARIGRNPATGEAIQIKASKKVGFRAAKDLKMAV
jgi:DNA-binding protein HU-beta